MSANTPKSADNTSASPPPDPVFIRNPITGRAVEATPEQAQQLAQRGGNPISEAEYQAAQRAQQNLDYVDQNYSGPEKFAAGVGSGLTLGLGPAALAYTGLADPGHISALQTSGLYQAGDIAGMVAPAILSGGESAAVEGAGKGVIARALGATPAGMLARAGSASERLVGRLVPEAGVMGRLAKPALQMAARGATEASLINMSHTVADSVIQDKPLTWASVAASGADGALLGGLTGAALGGVGALGGLAMDSVGGGAARAASYGASREAASAKALRRLGIDGKALEDIGAREGGTVKAAKAYHDIIANGGESLASNTPAIVRVVKQAEGDFAKAASDSIATLDREAPSMVPNAQRVEGRIQTDLVAKYSGIMQNDVQKAFSKLKNDMQEGLGVAKKQPFSETPPVQKYEDPFGHQYAQDLEKYNHAKSLHESSSDLMPGKGATWEDWTKSRNHLADMVEETSGAKKAVYRTALNAFDDEIRGAMTTAGESIGKPGISDAYHADLMGEKMAKELHGHASGRALSEHATHHMSLGSADMSTMAYGMLSGHPIGAAGIVAGKKVAGWIQRRMEPAMAESAYRAAFGASSARATVNVTGHIRSTVKNFIMGTQRAAVYEHAKIPPVKYTRKAYEEAMASTEALTSAVHKQKVMQLAQQVAEMGHPIMAQEIVDSHQRAVDYLNYNRPASPKLQKAGSLTKLPDAAGFNMKEMKYLRIDHAIKNPLSLLDELRDGTLSRDEVMAVKYVYPPIHEFIVQTTAESIMEMKSEGKDMPADKVVQLATLLNAPVDSTTQKGYIDACQAGLAVNNAPQPPNHPSGGAAGPQPITASSAYQTPTQSAIKA